jgi:hypothetical protein
VTLEYLGLEALMEEIKSDNDVLVVGRVTRGQPEFIRHD